MILETLIGILCVIVIALILYIQYLNRKIPLHIKEQLAKEKQTLVKTTLSRSRAVLKGKIGEQMAPLLEAFPFEPADARFIGSPIDYIVFPGYSTNDPTEVVLIEIKTGKSTLTMLERKIQHLVKTGQVRWMTITI